MRDRNGAIFNILLLAAGAALGGFFSAGAAEAAAPAQGGLVATTADGLALPAAESSAELVISGPEGWTLQRAFAAGEDLHASLFEGSPPPDGSYTWELRIAPTGERLRRGVDDEAGAAGTGREAVTGGTTLFGHFTVADGVVVLDGEGVEGLAVAAGALPSGPDGGLENVTAADVVYIDDVIVSANLCVGFACVNGESFGDDVLRLKDVNNRIHFVDTSTGSYPTRDWRITVNDSTIGGADRFSIEDVTAGTTAFTILGAANDNAFYMDSNGDVGFGTATPVTDLHVVDGDTPTLRLQQDTSGSFAAQTWEIAGNETNFFIEDSDTGNLPFRIRGDAPSNSIYVAADGKVGLGTASPLSTLHVGATDVNALVVDTNTSEAARILLTLRNNGRVLLEMDDTSGDGQNWRFRTVEGQFNIDTDGSAGNELTLTQTGNMTIQGMLTELSDRDAKTSIQAVDPQEVLARLARLPLATWTYKKGDGARHLGPMAQDFYDLFGLGLSNLGLSTYDATGVALASLQALHEQVLHQEERFAQKEREIEELQRQNADLLRRLEALEAQR